jgi:SAM-dependent methyltransferase
MSVIIQPAVNKPVQQRKSTMEVSLLSPGYLANRTLQRDLAGPAASLEGRLLDLGCGNSPYRPLLRAISHYVAYDVSALDSKPEVIGQGTALPFETGSFDSVLSTQVLEHVPDPGRMIAEIARVLKPGGRLLLSAPQTWRLHEQPYDYYRYTRYGLQHLLRQHYLAVVSIQPQGGAWVLVGQIVNNILWSRPRRKFSLGWTAGMATTLLVNLAAVLLDRLFYDPDDTLNYVVLAERVDQ